MGLFNWLFRKNVQRGKRPDGASSLTSWQTGDRVLASWLDGFFYPGKIRQVQGDSCEIAFDDGDRAWVDAANVRRPDIKVGNEVFCRFHAGPLYLPGTIQTQNGEKIQVKYESGETEWTTISMVRVKRQLADVGGPPAQSSPGPQTGPGMPTGAGTPNFGGPGSGGPGFGAPNLGGAPIGTMIAAGAPQAPAPGIHIPDVGEPVLDSDWRVGDRVLGRWFDFYWYPATILALGTKGTHLLFDDGDQRVVGERGLMTLDVEEGEELFIRPKNQPQRIYTPARVLRIDGEVIDVEHEDGTQETNQKVSRARFWRCPVGVKLTFEEGERAWAEDIDGYTYPAEVLSIDNDKVLVHFLDGPERMLTPELIRPFKIEIGTAVECRWKGGQTYFPGKITQIDGDRVHLAYNDGDQEWTTVRLVRLPPK